MAQAGAVLTLLAAAGAAAASPLLFTFGADTSLGPTSLQRMNPDSASSVTNLATPLGDGSIGYNGGIVYSNGLLYAVGNDSNGNASIYSFDVFGQNLTLFSNDFNTGGDANGFVFSNGLAAIGGTLYAVGQGPSGEDLFQIGNGTATLVRSLATLNGTYAGIAWDPSLQEFYGLIANASGGFNGDYLVRFGMTGGTSLVASLSSLDGADAGTHLGGLADAGGGILYDIYTNVNDGNGNLEEIDVNGTPTVTQLYDTNIPLAQNAGIAAAPEPATGGAALVLIALILQRRRRLRNKRPEVRSRKSELNPRLWRVRRRGIMASRLAPHS